LETTKKEALALQEQVVAWRRDLHQIPETEMDTVQTEAYICACLDEMGIPYRKGVAGHGVVAVLKGSKPGKVFALRADCDGLPIKEETGLPFASKNGCMHACGHDVHTAMALGAAKILADNKDHLEGSVKFIFQPGEEGCKVGYGGAKRMIDDGALEDPRPDVIVALHTGSLWNDDLKPGDIGYRSGSFMACMDRFEIVVKGKGSHGAYPHGSIDPISIACHIVTELQTIVSREMNPVEPAVISIGEIHAGSAFNIIPGECRISGTVRALTNDTRKVLADRIETIAQTVAQGMRGEIEFRYGWEGPSPVVNDPDVTEELRQAAVAVLGEAHVKEIKNPSMGGEDIAFFLEEVPGTFFFHPSCNEEKGQIYPHHNSRFAVDEDVLWIGSAVMSTMAINWLKKHK
jgi:amidohydrolase